MYSPRKKITNYQDWLKYTLPETKFKDYAWVYEKTTGLPLITSRRPPNVCHLRTVKLDQWKALGLNPEDHYGFNVGNTEIVIPLLRGRNLIGGCLVAFRSRTKNKKLFWRRYKLDDIDFSETPLMAICNFTKETPDCLLVDNIADYLKLCRWFCDRNVAVCLQFNVKGIEILQKHFMKIKGIYDFTAKNKERIIEMANREQHKLVANELFSYQCNPIGNNKLNLLDRMSIMAERQKL